MAYGYGVYFTERERNRVIRWDPDSGQTEVVAGGDRVREPSQALRDPYGLAFEQDGTLLVSDKLNHRICRLRNGRLVPIPLRDEDGHRKRPVGAHPIFGFENIQCPCSLFVDAGGTILCAFYDDHTIYRISADGRLELAVGVIPQGRIEHRAPKEHVQPSEARSTPITSPVGVVARRDGTIYFIERYSGSVREYHPSRGLHSLFPHSGETAWKRRDEAPERGNLRDYYPAFPSTLAIDRRERLFLCDPAHRCVLRLDVAAGTFERVLTTPRVPRGGGPLAVAFGSDDTAWVADCGSQSIRAYRMNPDAKWTPDAAHLDQVQNEPLHFGHHGMGIVTGA